MGSGGRAEIHQHEPALAVEQVHENRVFQLVGKGGLVLKLPGQDAESLFHLLDVVDVARQTLNVRVKVFDKLFDLFRPVPVAVDADG